MTRLEESPVCRIYSSCYKTLFIDKVRKRSSWVSIQGCDSKILIDKDLMNKLHREDQIASAVILVCPLTIPLIMYMESK